MQPWIFCLRAVAGLGLATALIAGACSVYNEDLLESDGSGGSGNSGNNTPTGGTGGSVACTDPAQCPGTDGECGTRTCSAGVCGIAATAADTPTAQQTAGDCLLSVCDGLGAIAGRADDADVPNDFNDCTADTCSGGVPSFLPRPEGSGCSSNGGKVCSPVGVCVECLVGTDCTTGVCTQSYICADAACGDGELNGEETDEDCGGPECPQCAIGKLCEQPSDCLSGECSGTCQPSCTDGEKNENETDVDCGGADCPKCDFGEDCLVPADCASGGCSASHACTCPPRDGIVILSEFRTRGPNAGNDDFIELYNPGTIPVTLTSEWVVDARSDSSGSYGVRFTGAGEVVGAGQHFLIANASTSYSGAVPGDVTMASGITDKLSLRVTQSGTVIDAVCAYCGTMPDFSTYSCEGTPFENIGCTSSNLDRSVERKPGGVDGNCIDTGVSADDWQQINPSNPQNLASPPT